MALASAVEEGQKTITAEELILATLYASQIKIYRRAKFDEIIIARSAAEPLYEMFTPHPQYLDSKALSDAMGVLSAGCSLAHFDELFIVRSPVLGPYGKRHHDAFSPEQRASIKRVALLLKEAQTNY